VGLWHRHKSGKSETASVIISDTQLSLAKLTSLSSFLPNLSPTTPSICPQINNVPGKLPFDLTSKTDKPSSISHTISSKTSRNRLAPLI
jgi:hypothetical protein